MDLIKGPSVSANSHIQMLSTKKVNKLHRYGFVNEQSKSERMPIRLIAMGASIEELELEMVHKGSTL